MRLYVAVTDKDWFALHASKPEVEEVNFWRPSPDAAFKALQPGELLLFKLHSPDNFIAGGGFFTRFLQLPVNLVWDTFGEANGVRSQSEMRERIARLADDPAMLGIRVTEPGWPPNGEGVAKLRAGVWEPAFAEATRLNLPLQLAPEEGKTQHQ